MKVLEAIKYLDMMNKKIDFKLEGYVYGNEAIETVLQELEEQDKEIVKYQLYLTEEVIPTRKIEDKIKELRKKEKKCAKYSEYTMEDIIVSKISILQELLEEK